MAEDNLLTRLINLVRNSPNDAIFNVSDDKAGMTLDNRGEITTREFEPNNPQEQAFLRMRPEQQTTMREFGKMYAQSGGTYEGMKEQILQREGYQSFEDRMDKTVAKLSADIDRIEEKARTNSFTPEERSAAMQNAERLAATTTEAPSTPNLNGGAQKVSLS